MKHWFVKSIIILASILLLCAGIVQFAFNQWSSHTLQMPRKAHWMHRGLYDNKTIYENTLAAFDSALHKNIEGIEFDLFYIDSLNDFVISHDLPNRFGLPPLHLSTVLKRYDTSFSYWLDLKNLNEINKQAIVHQLNKLLVGTLKSKVYIESGNASPLGYLANQGFRTIYWVQYNRTNWLKKYLKKKVIQGYCLKYPFAGVSIAASMADEDFFDSFGNIPSFIFHIYTPEQYHQIKNHSNISVYLMDYIPAIE